MTEFVTAIRAIKNNYPKILLTISKVLTQKLLDFLYFTNVAFGY